MALVDKINISSVWVNSDVRGTNDTGTPIVSAVLSGTGEEISGDYTLLISSRSGSTGTVTVNCSTSNNPYDGKVTTGVVFDDATINKTVLPGVSIVFDNAAADSDGATVEVGKYQGSFDASGVGAGTPSAGLRHKVVNTGSNDVSDAKAGLRTQVVHIDKTGRVFQYVKPFADNAIEKIAGGGSVRTMPYALTISGVSGSGAGRVATLSLDGVAVPADNLQDLTTGGLVSGTGIKSLSPGYPYLFVDGPLEGMEFALDVACANSDAANILVFPSRYVQIASDTAGSPGVYGSSDVVLTETGEASGVVTASGEAFYWSRMLVPASAGSESNPYPCTVALECSESQSAGWGE